MFKKAFQVTCAQHFFQKAFQKFIKWQPVSDCVVFNHCFLTKFFKKLKNFLNKLEGKKQFARAAALAVFNLEIRLALQILEKVDEKEETLQLVAMALAGFR